MGSNAREKENPGGVSGVYRGVRGNKSYLTWDLTFSNSATVAAAIEAIVSI